MGCMAASDAAALPRLGEVFFDVRGESRTMRLSWYADTGVAVFSIWQGGTCTGTFRLPIADLPRMVEALRRGPHGHDDQVTGEQPGPREPRRPAAPGAPPPRPELDGYRAEPPPPGYPPEPPARYRDQPLAGDPGYQTTPRPQPGHRGKAPRRRRGSPPAPAVTAEAGQGHRDVDPPGDPGEYPAGLAPGFPDEYPAGPSAADFSAPRGSRHRGRERDEDPAGYFDEPPAPDPPHEHPAGYRARPEPGYP